MRRILLVALLLLCAAFPAAAQGDSITIRDFRAEYAVRPDGAVDVTETLRFAFFGPWNGINRDVSLRHRTAQGQRRKLRIDFSPPTDEAGTPLRYETESPDSWTRRLKIWVPGAQDAERTVVVRYRVANAIRFFEAKGDTAALDELYWNVTGNAWTMPIERVEARFALPGGAAPRQAAAYTGAEGSTERAAEVRMEPNGVTVLSGRRLEAGEGLTAAVGWPAGMVPRPDPDAEATAEAARRWPFLLPFLAFFLALRTWRRRGRDPEELEIVVGYEPPHGMSPAEMGTLVDHTVDMRDITATLVDLAVRGFIGIEEREKRVLGIFSSTEYIFHLRRPREAWGTLAEHERRFMVGLFSEASPAEKPWDAVRAAASGDLRDGTLESTLPGGAAPAEAVSLAELQNKFYRSISGIKDAVYDALTTRGYYRHRPDRVKGFWAGGGIALVLLGVVAGTTAGEAGLGWVDGVALGVGLAASGLIVLGFGLVMPARTVEGARAREAALGFREFLDKVESDRFRRMITSPELFERFLPHAMAFGVEKHWAHAFDDLLREPPDWYSGSNMSGFRASSFTSNMSALSSQAGSTMASSPSGSGGGGSSGGGSGGGGGSGF